MATDANPNAPSTLAPPGDPTPSHTLDCDRGLLDGDAPNTHYGNGCTALVYSAANGDEDTVKAFLERTRTSDSCKAMDKMTLDAGDSCVCRTRDLHDVMSFAKAADKAAHGGHMGIARLVSAACYEALPDWSSVALCEYLNSRHQLGTNAWLHYFIIQFSPSRTLAESCRLPPGRSKILKYP